MIFENTFFTIMSAIDRNRFKLIVYMKFELSFALEREQFSENCVQKKLQKMLFFRYPFLRPLKNND